MSEKIFSMERYAKLARQAVADGIVMLRNEEKVLPLKKGTKLALFGRSQFNYYKSGTGSGGMVNTAYVVGIKEALEKDERFILNQRLEETYQEWLADHPFDMGNGWAQEPWFQEEMPLSEALVQEVREESDTAVILIGRTAGEDKDNSNTQGSFLLTTREEAMLEVVCRHFEKTIVLLNVGNIIDMKWVEKYNPKAVLYVWQGGQEGGLGVLDVLSGDITPSGHLTDTIARGIEDYPSTKNYGSPVRNFYEEDIYVGYRYFSTFAQEKVLYPFGFGLSYTDFAVEETRFSLDEGDKSLVYVTTQVRNVGDAAGRAVLQLYAEAPQGKLGKVARSLCAFRKTKLLAPGETEKLEFAVAKEELASYDDAGLTGNKSCYVLEAGEYNFYLGENVRDAKKIGGFSQKALVVTKRLEEALAPVAAFDILTPGERSVKGEQFEEAKRAASLRTLEPSKKRQKRLPKEYAFTGDKGYVLADVKEGKVSMGEFLGQLSNEELCCLVRGEGMCSPKVTPGTAAAFGGVTDALLHYGIPVGCCADGPSGIRMDCGTIAFAMPNGTCLAATFDEELVQELYECAGLELRKNKIDSLLGPGLNIHRNPLNGRNFEYFSEDPLVTGRMAVAQLRGMHKYDVTGTIKHFACNNQEFKRYDAEAVVSERAAREIYLKAFEMAVKEGGARSIMSTYGPLNGFWTSSNYDLLTAILRDEWGYTGIVMTDWWAMGGDEGEKPDRSKMAAMIRAQNDIYMVTGDALANSNGDDSKESLEEGKVTRGEYQRSAANLCRFLMQAPAFERFLGRKTALDEELEALSEAENGSVGKIVKVPIPEDEAYVDPAEVDTSKGTNVTLEVTVVDKVPYQLEITCRASKETSEVAQLPVSVFLDRGLVTTMTLMGAQKEWETHVVKFPEPPFNPTFFLKLYFSVSGLEIKTLRVVKSDEAAS